MTLEVLLDKMKSCDPMMIILCLLSLIEITPIKLYVTTNYYEILHQIDRYTGEINQLKKNYDSYIDDCYEAINELKKNKDNDEEAYKELGYSRWMLGILSSILSISNDSIRTILKAEDKLNEYRYIIGMKDDE